MKPNFVPLTLQQFQDVVARYPFKRKITMVHVHHTWRPRKKDYRGVSTIESMWRFHTEVNGWPDIAQHVSIAPDGTIWTGRSWDVKPASSKGHNGTDEAGPFMFEIIGDFDAGQEKLEGSQREAVLGVIVAIQRKHHLAAEDFKFHRELGSPKSCPGTGLERAKLLAEVQAAHANAGSPQPPTRARGAQPFDLNRAEAIGLALNALSERGAVRSEAVDSEDSHDDATYAARVVLGRDLLELPPGARGSDEDIDPAILHSLRPHVVNLTGGLFSTSGVFQTSQEDVDRIFDEHLPHALEEAKSKPRPLRILFWAHGGLVGEKGGLAGAARHVAWWKQNDIYPIYFVWETGLLATIGQIIRGAKGRMRAIDTRDLWDHTTDPLIEIAAKSLGGTKVWGGMKFSAERASAAGGGAHYVAKRLGQFCKDHAAEALELHAAGHSAGSIFHSHFLPAALKEKVPPFESLHFLAPAVRLDLFLERLDPQIGSGIKRFTMFTMAKDWEKRDNVIKVYRKSLLYLISLALEPNGKTPILGLEETVRGDPQCRKLFGIDGSVGRGLAVWSKTAVTSGLASTSTSHSDFDEDPPTMNSVVRSIRGPQELAPIVEYPRAPARRSLEEEEIPEELAWAMKLTAPSTTEPAITVTVDSAPPVPTVSTSADGGRFALCIGIDQYKDDDAKLNGCVNDARAWERSLTNLGFKTELILNADATRERIVAEVTTLLGARRAGDVVVLQYSGHGTRLPDVDGDEDDAEDEAMCPVDFDAGHFVIDDDLRALFANIPTGVALTCFFDCCHSGTITRVVQQRRMRAMGVRGGRPKKRSLRATPAMIELHRAFRKSRAAPRAAALDGDMAEVVFTACRSDQVAFESDGQGDFTRIALELLQAGLPDETNDDFQKRVVHAFGEDARQEPQLNASTTSKTRRLFSRR